MNRILPLLSRCVLALPLLATATCADSPTRSDVDTDEPLRVIFDTDMRADCDDAGALAVLHALQDQGACQLLGVVASTTGPHVVAAIDAMNTFYGRDTEHWDPFAPDIALSDNYPKDQTNDTAPTAAALYRRLLANAPDASVKIIVVGMTTGVHELLLTDADHESDGIPFSGPELVAAKVIELVQMGGVSPGDRDSFNLGHDEDGAVYVEQHFPAPITYSPDGGRVRTGAALTDPARNPTARAYELYPDTEGGAGVIGNRQSWDQVAALYAVRGTSWDGVDWFRRTAGVITLTAHFIPEEERSNRVKDYVVVTDFQEGAETPERAYVRLPSALRDDMARQVESRMVSGAD